VAKVLSVVWREASEKPNMKFRIISFRKATKRETEIYFRSIQD